MRTYSFHKRIFCAWAVWIIAAFFYFYKYILEVAPSVMTKDLMDAFSIKGVQLGNLAAAYFYAYLIMQVPVGLLLDRFGPRKVTTIAIFFCAMGNFLFAYSDSLWSAGAGRFIIGLGASFAVINTFKLTANWFPSNRFAFMAGLLLSFGMLGAVGGQAPLSYFIFHTGWRSAMASLGWVGIFFGVLFWLIVRDHPEKTHLKSQIKVPFWKGKKKIFTNPQNWLLSFFSCFLFTPIMAFGELWGVNFVATAFELTQHIAAFSVSMIFIGFAIAAPFFGWLSDRMGRRKPILIFGTGISLLLLLLILYLPIENLFIAYLLLFLFGAFISTFLLSYTMIRENNSPFYIATAIGFLNMFSAVMGAVSDPLIGLLLDLKWDGQMLGGAPLFSLNDYRFALSILPILLFIGLVLLAFIKETYCKQIVND
jgi:MFS family permease